MNTIMIQKLSIYWKILSVSVYSKDKTIGSKFKTMLETRESKINNWINSLLLLHLLVLKFIWILMLSVWLIENSGYRPFYTYWPLTGVLQRSNGSFLLGKYNQSNLDYWV